MTAKGDHYFSHLVNMTQDSKVDSLLTVVAVAGELLTRFNKIAIQGTPQMAADKEAIVS